jgi:hypothetical protein
MPTSETRCGHSGTRALTVLLLGAALGAGYFVLRDVLHYFTFSPNSFSDYYWSRRYGLVSHVSAGLARAHPGASRRYGWD